VRDAAGEQTIAYAALRPLLGGEVLHSGLADPVNGASDSQERELIRRNPRARILGASGERRALGQMLLASALLNLCALTIPLYMRAIYDRVVPDLAIESLSGSLSIGVVMVLLCSNCCSEKVKSRFVDRVATRVGQAVQHRAVVAVLRARAPTPGMGFGAMLAGLRDLEQLSLLVPLAIATFCVDLPFVALMFALIAAIGGLTVLGPMHRRPRPARLRHGRRSRTQARQPALQQAHPGAQRSDRRTHQRVDHDQGQSRRGSVRRALGCAFGPSCHRQQAGAPLVGNAGRRFGPAGPAGHGHGGRDRGARNRGWSHDNRRADRSRAAHRASHGARRRDSRHVCAGLSSLAQFNALAGLLQSEPERDVSDPAISHSPVRGAIL